ncbi:MAG: TRAP transporter large permease subunit [Alphaproteobacteria bacterium]|nr:TRAP transporter large permease subunit [Alphaproteobacteria bacterium]
MAAFLAQNMAPIMFASLILVLLLGYPVAFSLAAVGLIYFAVGVELAPLSNGVISLDWPLLAALPERVWGVMSNDTMLAIPFFTFMGLILERSGMAEDLLDTIGQLFGPVRGGLAYAVIFVGALLAATTGVVAASVISMGLISLPIMLRYGYDRRLAAGTIAASGTLAQIIPPSLVLIVMADQLGKSVGDMYRGAFIPGLVLTSLYAAYVFAVTLIKPEFAPALPLEARSIPEHKSTAPRIGLISALGLMVLATPFFHFVIESLIGLSDGSDQSLANATHPAGWIGAIAMSVLTFASYMVGPRADILGRAARINTFIWFGLAALIAAEFFDLYRARFTDMAADNALVWSASTAVLLLYLIAQANRLSRLGLMSNMAQTVILALVPPLTLIFLVLGTIFVGIATPTEGGAMGAMGAILIGWSRRRLDLGLLRQAMDSTAKLSTFVVFILIGARVFSLTFYGVNGHNWVEHLLTSLPGGQVGFLIFVNLFVFILAFFLDFFELAFIVIPMIGPAAQKLGIDPIWLGVMLGVNMQTSFMHPPFGFALFFLRSVAPSEPYQDRVTGASIAPVTTSQIYWGALPFVGLQLVMVLLVILFPAMVMVYKSNRIELNPQQIEDQLKSMAPKIDAQDPPPLKF